MKKILALALVAALSSTAALAQAWRADLEFGQDGWSLIIAVCALLAFFAIRDTYKKHKAKGIVLTLAIAAYAVAAWFIPILRILMVILTLFFFFVAVWSEWGPRRRR